MKRPIDGMGTDSGIGGRNDAKQADTRERIVDAARTLFVERGYAATPMSAIARDADVVRATVYNNFADKGAILATIVTRYLQGYAAIGRELRRTQDARRFSQLLRMTQMALDWRIANADLRPLIDVARNTPGSGWEEANAAADAALLEWLSEVHAEARAEGLTHERLDLSIATPAVYSMVESALSTFDVTTPRPRVRHAAKQLTLLHWRAIFRVPPDLPGVA